MDAPTVTHQDVHALLDCPNEDPVLYVQNGPDDDGTGPLTLEVWAAVLVPHSSVVARRDDLPDWLQEAPDPDGIEELLPELQEKTEQIAEELRAFH